MAGGSFTVRRLPDGEYAMGPCSSLDCSLLGLASDVAPKLGSRCAEAVAAPCGQGAVAGGGMGAAEAVDLVSWVREAAPGMLTVLNTIFDRFGSGGSGGLTFGR